MISSFFVLTGYQIVTLNYDHRYLQLLMSISGRRNFLLTIRSSFFCHDKLHNDNITPKKTNYISNHKYNYVQK